MHLCKIPAYCVIKKKKVAHSLHTNICLGLRITSGIVPSSTLLQSCTTEIHEGLHSALANKIEPLHVNVPCCLNLIFVQQFEPAGWVRLENRFCLTTMRASRCTDYFLMYETHSFLIYTAMHNNSNL